MKKYSFLLILFIGLSISLNAQVKIGGTPVAAHPSAVLEIDGGVNKGLLFPRMTKQNMLDMQNPAEGLTVYTTDEKAVYIRQATAWVNLLVKSDQFKLPYTGSVATTTAAFSIQNTEVTDDGVAIQGERLGFGTGVVGKSLGGNGVHGISIGGIGGVFSSTNGLALATGEGKITFGGYGFTDAKLYVDGSADAGKVLILNDEVDPEFQMTKNGINMVNMLARNSSFLIDNSSGKFEWRKNTSFTNSMVLDEGELNLSKSLAVGFTNTAPLAALHIKSSKAAGNPTFIADANDPLFTLKNAGVDKGFIALSDDNIRIGTFANNDLGNFVIRTNGGDRVVVRPDGKMVLGSPTGSAPVSNHLLAVKGRIAATEFTITNIAAWPDYVFADDYKLKSLEETEAFIKANKHLPNIPAAAEIEKNGLELGDMQKRMMEKIEELTLHLIESNKQINQLTAVQSESKQQIDELKQQVKMLQPKQ
jgi:hypothetical protein